MESTCRPNTELKTSGSCGIICGSVDNGVGLPYSPHCCAVDHPGELIFLPIDLQTDFNEIVHYRPRLRNLTVYVWKFE